MNQATKDFILNHANEDVNKLALKSKSYTEVDISIAIKQIEGKQKIKNKIPTFFTNNEILYPHKLSLEQSSSEITAKYKSFICKGYNMADLTGGFGIDCFFLSHNFQKIYYVERQKELCDLAMHNFKILEKPAIEVIHSTSEDFLKTEINIDWIFIDPSRRKESGAKAVFLSDCEPNVFDLQNIMLEKAENVMIKLSPMIDISQLRRDLHFIKEIHVLSVENECKEILVILKRGYNQSINFFAVNFPQKKSIEVFDFEQNDEKNSISSLAESVQNYLYEPNASILKSGAFKIIGNKFQLSKLHKNSHLYTSNELKSNFYGRIFEVKKVLNFNKEELKKMDLSKANIAARNFPISVKDLRNKIKIKEGGNDYVFATTLQSEKKVLIICNKIR